MINSIFMTDPYCLTSCKQENLTEDVKVNVIYKTKLRREQLIEAIRGCENPQVIFWYIGTYGLREQGVKYYRKDLSKILQTSNAECQLYDLTAWAPFSVKSSDGTVQDFNKNADLINQFAIPRIRCLKSCDYFKWLCNLNLNSKLEDLKKVLKERNFIFKASQDFPDAKRTIGDIFQKQCPLLEELYEQDCAKYYSTLQYIEGIYLIETIVQQALSQNAEQKTINLIFALPNQEANYYFDEENSFMKDVKAVLQDEYQALLKGKTVNVMFYSFMFGDGVRNRPYNAGPTNIEKLQQASDIVQISSASLTKEEKLE